MCSTYSQLTAFSILQYVVNVAQDVNEEWPLEVYGHDGVATNVTMAPGDMVRLTALPCRELGSFPISKLFSLLLFHRFCMRVIPSFMEDLSH